MRVSKKYVKLKNKIKLSKQIIQVVMATIALKHYNR